MSIDGTFSRAIVTQYGIAYLVAENAEALEAVLDLLRSQGAQEVDTEDPSTKN